MLRRAIVGGLEGEKTMTVLDLGCGDGSAVEFLGLPENFEMIDVDIFEPYLKLAKRRGIYKKLVKADIREFYPKEKFDIVLASHVLEHLEKNDGLKLIKKIEKFSKKRVIIACPIGDLPQEEYDNNPFQVHRSSWTVNEMKNLGYEVRSQGLKALWGNENVVLKYGLFSYILFPISILSFPVLLLKPELGTYMICVKDVK